MIENSLHTLKVETQGELSGANDSLTKAVGLIESELSLVK